VTGCSNQAVPEYIQWSALIESKQLSILNNMRLLLFSGKGGVGKSSLAAATGVSLSRMGYRTLVMSVDPAHSLADAFDLSTDLFHGQTSDPLPIGDNLAVHEVNIQREIKRYWTEISAYRPRNWPFCRGWKS
jgi:anion-transporting  ArsA/GET3 family ATPase